MKKSVTFFLFALLCMMGSSLQTKAQAIPDPSAMWTFNNAADLMAASNGSLQLVPAVLGNKSVTLCATPAEANITQADGPAASNKAVFVPATSALAIQRGEGSPLLSTFTVMIDIKVSDSQSYDGLFQMNTVNNNDGELFLHTGNVGVGAMGYGGTVENDKWYRIVLHADGGKVGCYLNGQPINQCDMSSRWEIEDVFYVLCDEDGEKVDTYLAKLAFWETPLTEAQIAALGDANSRVGSEPGTIATAEELVAFSAAVNSGADQDATLTADIDMAGIDFTPIGTQANLYKGTFDGNGHVIYNLTVTKGVDANGGMGGVNDGYAGLFGAVTGGATIKNFTLKNAKLSAPAFVGIIGGSYGSGTITIDALGFEGEATGTAQNISGIIGVNMGSSATFRISNCYVTGKVAGGNESAAISGWTGGGQVENCWASAEVSGVDGSNYMFRGGPSTSNIYSTIGQGEAITADMLTSGELAYAMNGDQSNIVWYQTLGTDSHPVLTPSSKRVYVEATGGYKCDGTPLGDKTFTNDEVIPDLPEHEFEGYFCKNCGQIDEEFVTPENNYYTLATAEQLAWFAEMVNAGHTTMNAYLKADVDMSAYNDYKYMIGKDGQGYAGIFDGLFHTVTVNYNLNSQECPNLFRYLNGGTVRNIITTGTIATNQKFATGLVGKTQGAGGTLQNVSTYVVINSSVNGDGTHAGLLGVADAPATITNALSAAVINGGDTNCCGGLVGWASANVAFHNCLMIGEINVQDSGSATFSRNSGGNTYDNCYYKEGVKELEDNAKLTKVTAAQLASGEVCKALSGPFEGGAWRQTLGADDAPHIDPTHLGVTVMEGQYVNVDANGTLQIGTPEALVLYANTINSGTKMDAQLIADIDMAGVAIEPIGTTSNLFTGTFDGQGHIINNLTIEKEGVEYVGLFGVVGGGATIKDFTLKNAKLSGQAFIGIVGGSNGSGTVILDKLGFEGEAIGTAQNVSGIIGVNMSSAAAFQISNCYVMGKIAGGRESAAITGWTGGGQSSIVNCWSAAEVSGNDEGKDFYRNDATVWSNCYNQTGTQVTKIDDAILTTGDFGMAGGEFCFILNGNKPDGAWRQTLGTDPYPVLTPTSKIVYALASDGYNCDGTPKGNVTYTNTEQAVEIPAHEYEGFVCKNCGTMNPSFVKPKNGIYNLSTADQLAWFALKINTGDDKALNAVLTADIDMSAYPGVEYTIGTDGKGYAGTFDGQFHTVKVAYVNNRDGGTEVSHSTALFRFVNGGTVKNIITTGTIETNQKFASGLVGKSQGNGATMENVATYITINSAVNGDGTHAGFLGVADAPATITNALSAIIINGDQTTCCGGLSGWASQPVTFTNCLMVGEINVQDDGSATYSRNPGGNTYNNCYYKDGVKELQDNGSVTKVSAEQLAGGEITYALNGNKNGGVWRQTLGADETPVLNQNSLEVAKAGDSYVNLNNGAFEIASVEDLTKFAAAVNGGANTLNGILTADLDLNGIDWTSIGTGNGYGKAGGTGDVTNIGFAGTFDGQGHTVSNFIIKDGKYDSEPEAAGLFGIVTGTVKNVGVINASYDATKDCRAGGLVGAVVASSSSAGLVENCFVINSKILSGSRVVGGLAGAVYGGTVKNCYAANNELSGYGDRFGGIAGDTRSDNSWNGTVINCYTDYGRITSSQAGETTGGQAGVTAEQFASGEIATLLGPAFRQNLGDDPYPVLDPTHGVVVNIKAAGYATLYVPQTAVTIPEGVKAYAGTVFDDMLWLHAVEDAVPADEAVVVKGAAGLYNFMPTNEAVAIEENDLKGSVEPLVADGSQYVLSAKNNTIDFLQAEGIITPGKAYLEVTDANVKSFGVTFDGETGIEAVQSAEPATQSDIFDLSGRRVEKATKGIYIINGKKVLVK